MDSLTAFAIGEAHRNSPMRVFDWDKAARLIAERNPSRARAGLQSDWEWTGGDIYADRKPVSSEETYTYLASTWATPELDLDGDVSDCWIYVNDSPGWDARTYWPESAIAILNGES